MMGKCKKSEENVREVNGKVVQGTPSPEQQTNISKQKKIDGTESTRLPIKDVCVFTGGKVLSPGKSNEGDLHEVIVPYQRFSTERFYYWPPQVLPSESDGRHEVVTKKNL